MCPQEYSEGQRRARDISLNMLTWVAACIIYYLQPTEKAEVRVAELGLGQESGELDPVVRLGARGLGLTVVDAGLVQDALDEELQEAVVAGHAARRGGRFDGRGGRGRRAALRQRLLPLRGSSCKRGVEVPG